MIGKWIFLGPQECDSHTTSIYMCIYIYIYVSLYLYHRKSQWLPLGYLWCYLWLLKWVIWLSGDIHIYIYIYTYTVHIYTYTHIHMYTYTHIHIYSHTHTHVHTYTHIHIHTCVCMYIYIHTQLVYIRWFLSTSWARQAGHQASCRVGDEDDDHLEARKHFVAGRLKAVRPGARFG